MTYKPFLTYEEQIDKLVNEYGLVINDRAFALQALASLSYYDLINGYQEVYMYNGKFIANVSIEYLTMIHIFNKNVQSVLLKYATYIENTFKTALSYEISSHIGVKEVEYLDMRKYRNLKKEKHKIEFKKTIKNIKKAFGSDFYYADNPTKHYIETKDHVPPWILLKNVSFYDATNWYSFLKQDLRENICENLLSSSTLEFESKDEVLKKSLILIRKFRNVIAHNLKFITYKIKNSDNKIPKEINTLLDGDLIRSSEMKLSRDDSWGMILSMIALNSNKDLKKNFMMDLIYTLTQPVGFTEEEAKLILEDYCIMTQLPKDIVTRLNNYLSHLNGS